MKLHLLTTLAALSWLGLTAAGKLSPKYLPPNYAGTSGGHAGLLQSPRGAPRPSNQYLAPHHAAAPRYHGVSSAASHGAPAAHHGQHYVAAASAPASASHYGGHNKAAAQIPILRSDYTDDGNGNYNFGFQTGNGIRRDETGEFKGGWPHGSPVVKGSYSYTGDDGRVYTVNYKADDTGFHAEGDHLPTPPPVPREIQESLALHHSGRSSGASYGHHAAAASAHSPSAQYLPPQQSHHHNHQQQQQQGYNYGRRHY